MPLGQPTPNMNSTTARRHYSAASTSRARRYRQGNLLQKLRNRETLGEFIRGVGLTREPAKQLFARVPERLIFSLKDTMPNLGAHILMGATRCGQILLTYTFQADSASDFYPTMSYRYRLHFWLFRPGRAAAKIGEVQLFDGNVVTELLSIGIVQWPNDNERLLVYGTCQGTSGLHDGWGLENECKSSTYITLTTLPCLTGCEKCRAVAASFDEEEMAAGWDCGVGLSCMRHGLTVHTQFNAPHVYPFDPDTCLASGNRMVFNTGAFLHSFSVSVESGGSRGYEATESSLTNRLSYSFLRDWCYSVFVSDDWACNMTQLLVKKLGEPRMLFQIEISQFPLYLQYALQRHIQKYNTLKCKSKKGQTDKSCSNWVAALLSHEGKKPKQRWFSSNTRSLRFSNLIIENNSKSVKRIEKAENVYDFMETDDLSCEPKFKLFRRRCLADKMYEFRSDDDIAMDNENIYPGETSPTTVVVDEDKKIAPDEEKIKKPVELSTMVKAIMADWEMNARDESEAERRERVVGKFMSGIFCGSSTDSHLNSPVKKVSHIWSPLKPLNKKGGGYPVASPIKSTSRTCRQQKPFELSDEMREEMEKGFGHQPVPGCSVKFTRRYIEVDQEITSTITDVEDDDENGTGFHCALPVLAHGSSYSQMEMIANAKAVKLGILNAAVRQSSLDIEQLCFKAAIYICSMEGFRFWFCSDYDTEIVRVCYETGDVLGVLFIRLNAEDLRDAQLVISNKSAPEEVRNFYETQCLYLWSPSKCQVHLEGFKSLRKVPMVKSRPWCPAGKEARNLRPEISMCKGPEPRHLFHQVTQDGIPGNGSLEIIVDHDNLIGFRKEPNVGSTASDSSSESALN